MQKVRCSFWNNPPVDSIQFFKIITIILSREKKGRRGKGRGGRRKGEFFLIATS
jgi:hypothetical protein